MSYVSQLDAHADWLESQADAADAREEQFAEDLAEAWDDCLKARDLDAPIWGGYFSDMTEVLGEACSTADQTINRALMQALVDLANKGQVEAIQALDLVKDYFIEKTMEFKK